MKKLHFLWVIALLMLSGCAVNYLTQSKSYSADKKSYRQIAVIGVSKSHVARAQFEEEVAAKLQARGVFMPFLHLTAVLIFPWRKCLRMNKPKTLIDKCLRRAMMVPL